MKLIETRGNDGNHARSASFSEAIRSPIASFGGLYAPVQLPRYDEKYLEKLLQVDYKTLAHNILQCFELDIADRIIDSALDLYDQFDDPSNPIPVVKVMDDLYISELFHGPTRAFKDIALQPFGIVLSSLAQQAGEDYLIMAATSGDTGPAALECFKNRDNVRVICLYPDGGTSDVQRLQMVTEDAPNLKVIGINGDFDDAQNALKYLLGSKVFKKRLKEKAILLSAANSVNFGRIVFQIIYHIHSYLELVRQGAIDLGEKIYLSIPSGNFGNALGAYYAKKMGLPVEKILIASNHNNVLTQLINTGAYDLRTKDLKQTTSPAMDILKSSNIERVLFDLFGTERTKALMQQLETEQHYQLTAVELERLQNEFAADFCTDEQGKAYIKRSFDKGYLLDPHTATCLKVWESARSKPLQTVAYSTAEWTKFSPVIANALTGEEGTEDIKALNSIALSAGIEIPPVIAALFNKPIAQPTVIDKQEIEMTILKFLEQ